MGRDEVEAPQDQHHVVVVAPGAVPGLAGVDRHVLAAPLEGGGEGPGEVGVAPPLSPGAGGCGGVDGPAQPGRALLDAAQRAHHVLLQEHGVRSGSSGSAETRWVRTPVTSKPVARNSEDVRSLGIGWRRARSADIATLRSPGSAYAVREMTVTSGTSRLWPAPRGKRPQPEVGLGEHVVEAGVQAVQRRQSVGLEGHDG